MNHKSADHTHQLGKQITELDQIYHSMDFTESKYNKKEKVYQGELNDLIEYVKWITNETAMLRQRVRAAESVINQLRKSGETSVESLLDTLYVLKKKQKVLDDEADTLRMHVKTKEAMIKMKEDERGNLKACIENEKQEQDFEMNKLRKQLDEQKTLIGNQRKLLNQLQVMNEYSQGDITKASQELAKRVNEKENLNLQISEQLQAQTKLKTRHGNLENQITSLMEHSRKQRGQEGDALKDGEGEQRDDGPPFPMPKEKIRSKHSMFHFEREQHY